MDQEASKRQADEYDWRSSAEAQRESDESCSDGNGRKAQSDTRGESSASSRLRRADLFIPSQPPGTGKSQTIVSIIALLKLHFRIPQPILLAAPTHVSTDHLLSLLIRAGLNPLRSGKAVKVREDLRAWTVEKRREEHPLWTRLEEAREESESNRVRLQEFREAAAMQHGERTPEMVQEECEWSRVLSLRAELTFCLTVDLEFAYKKAWRRYIALEQRLYSSLFSTADVFCCTAMGATGSKVMSVSGRASLRREVG